MKSKSIKNPTKIQEHLEAKLKLIKEIVGGRVLFSIGIREDNKVDILKVERICYCAKTADDLVTENIDVDAPEKNPIKSYVG